MSNAPAEPAPGAGSGPSRLWYLLPVVVVVGALLAMGAFLTDRLSSLGDGLVQIVVPGKMELMLEPGSYLVFHERRSTVDGRIFSVEDVTDLGVTLASVAGQPVALAPTSWSSSYELAGRSGSAVLEFEIENPGAYVLSAAYREGVAGPQTVLAVGRAFGSNLLLTVLGSLVIVFAGLGLAIAIGWKIFVKRGAARGAGEDQAARPV